MVTRNTLQVLFTKGLFWLVNSSSGFETVWEHSQNNLGGRGTDEKMVGVWQKNSITKGVLGVLYSGYDVIFSLRGSVTN